MNIPTEQEILQHNRRAKLLRIIAIPAVFALTAAFVWFFTGHLDLLLPWDRSVLGFAFACFLAPIFFILAISTLKTGSVSHNYPRKVSLSRNKNPFGFWLSVVLYQVVAITCSYRVVSHIIAIIWHSPA
jgi:hypothetical protein